MISIFLVEDNPDAAFLISELLKQNQNFLYKGMAPNGKEGLIAIETMQPDVALIDIGLPDIDGIEIVRLLRPTCPNTQFIMCTAIDTDEKVFEALKTGASSYMLKSSTEEEMVTIIEGVYEGQSPMNSDIARKFISMVQLENKPNTPDQSLNITPKEGEILNLLAKGHSYKEISDLANITIKTLKGRIYRLYEKLHVDNRTEAINKYFGK